MQAQTLQNPTFGTVTSKTNVEDNSATKVLVQDATGKFNWILKSSLTIPDASETVKGKLELATAAETLTGTDNTRAVHPLGLKGALDLKANIDNPVFTTAISTPIVNVGMQSISSKSNHIEQLASSDWLKIYIYYTSTDKTEMVFEVGDNGEPFSGDGQRFRFHYDASSGGTAKDPFIVDYNTSTFDTDVIFNGATPLTIASFDASKNLKSLPLATYPSLTELALLKGVTSSVQTQLNGKQATLTNPVTGTGTANFFPKFTGASTIGNSVVQENSGNIGINTGDFSSTVGGTNLILGNSNLASRLTFKTNAGIMTGYVYNDSSETSIGYPSTGNFYIQRTGVGTVATFNNTGVLNIANLAGPGDAEVVTDLNGNLKRGNAVVSGVKRYKALISQTGTSAPTVIVLENSLGTITYGYSSVGGYTITSPALFTVGKTYWNVQSGPNANTTSAINQATSSSMILWTTQVSTGANINAGLNSTPILIEVYP